MLLYNSAVSGNCYKVRLLLAQLGLEYETVELSVVDRSNRGEVLGELNPAQRVPTLILDDGRPLAESNAILWYLGDGAEYVPTDPYERGQYAYYGKAGGCLITGNEDGIKDCSLNILYSLQHLGYTIPPQADAGWIGEAGPCLSYLDPGSGGPENDFTNRNTTFMTLNLLHLARLLKEAGGVPAHGNQRSLWDAGCRNDCPNPEHR
jgi:glutaredoxin